MMAIDMSARSHGFVYPLGLPPCAQCGRDANDPSHVNPAKGGVNSLMTGSYAGGVRVLSADKESMKTPRRSHAYATGYASFASIPCQACGQPIGASCHTAGMPAGAGLPQMASQGPAQKNEDTGVGSTAKEGYGQIVLTRHPFVALEGTSSVDAPYKLCAKCGFSADDEVHQNTGDGDADKNLVSVKQLAHVHERTPPAPVDANVRPQRAFVTQLNGKVILSAPASVFSQPDEDMPREVAAEWEKASAQNPHFMWIDGRFVEADRPNRNRAAWSSADLEMGEPTVAHGPLNWLHEERHIVGTIAAAKLVTTRQAAGTLTAEELPNNHIRALAAVWNYLWPVEGRQIAQASDERKLWYSMECTSREVACLQDSCTHRQSYRDYMLMPQTRCQHIKAGANRQFVDPTFLGGAVIIPPVRPGWGGANATVMRQAAMMAERQEASLEGLTEAEAVAMVAQIITYAGGTA